jgi:YegS/Rv2252/BmrU family lipid kinase
MFSFLSAIFGLMNIYIINPNAGSNSASNIKKLVGIIKEDATNIIWETTAPKEAYQFAQKALSIGASRIIAVGGDGTINEVASALVGTNIPIGIIPFGSGNGLARHLSIPLNLKKALNLALHGKVNKIDVGIINQQYFFCTAGIGFDAAVANVFSKGKGRGLANYIKATLNTIFKYHPIQIAINDGPKETVFSLTIANANQFGNNAFISPLSNIQDGVLEVVKIREIGLIRAFFIAIRLFKGNIHESKKVEVITTKKININYQSGAPIHFDGEAILTDKPNLSIEIIPKSLSVIC